MRTTRVMYTVLVLVGGLRLGAFQAFCQSHAFRDAAKGVQAFIADDRIGRNQVVFHSKAPMEDIFGAAAGVSGTVRLDPSKIEETARGEIVIQARSMTTGLKQRDRDMLGEHWLDVGRYPTITFKLKKLTGVKSAAPDRIEAVADGDFTLHGVTRSISIPVTLTYLAQSPVTLTRAPGDFLVLQSKFSVNFADHGIAGNTFMLGTRVAKTIDLDVSIYCTNSPKTHSDD